MNLQPWSASNLFLTAVALALLIPARPARAVDVHVAVAANFAGPMSKIGAAFGAATGHTVKISSGATGKFHAQVVAGAPFDVLLAADVETPKRLIAAGHAVVGTNFTYAIGRLVLWSVRPGFVDDEGAVLASDRITHLAIANPKLAPYGAAAVEVIRARGLTDVVRPKLVTAESTAQAYQFAFTGNAQAAFVALSQVVGGSYWLVPPALYSPIRQDAVLLKPGAKKAAAAALLAYLKSDAATRVMRDHGYGPAP
jgi:molybdate transport system substrate-binding protein